jgi:hypothetical protein
LKRPNRKKDRYVGMQQRTLICKRDDNNANPMSFFSSEGCCGQEASARTTEGNYHESGYFQVHLVKV